MTTSPYLFGTDSVLLYNVEPWKRLGFGVPNFGVKSKMNPDRINTIGTMNVPLHNLADQIGRLQLFIMTHMDAARTQPPTRNTIERLGKLCNRVSKVLSARMVDTNELIVEPIHSRPAVHIWNVHPVPYFSGPFLRNPWLREYNELVMIALCNFYQHADNNQPLTVTVKFAQEIYQFFREIKLRMGTELLRIPRATLEDDEFEFTREHYENYFPNEVVTNMEALDGPGPMFSMPTESDLDPLYRGFAANLILPDLAQYPIGPVPGATGAGGEDLLDEKASAQGTGGIGGKGATAIGRAVV